MATPTPTVPTPPTVPPPIAIDGINMPPVPPSGSPPGTSGTVLPPTLTADSKSVASTVLYQQGDVTITRDRVSGGDQFADSVVIRTGNADDDVQITRGAGVVAGTELLNVRINGQPFEITLNETLPGQARQTLAVRTGDGNDTIHAADDVRTHMDVQGGAGDDAITTGRGRDRVDGGAGNDRIQTGAGRDDVFGNTGDDVIDAGAGDDVVYGGDGNDTLRGDAGRDYLEGGRGNDILEGGDGQDVLSGGQGADTLRGGRGNDRVYTGTGADTVDNQSGRDVVYGQAGEDTQTLGRGARNRNVEVGMGTVPGAPALGHSITISGSPEFTNRVEADIEMLLASPNGRQMLAALDQAAAAPPAGKGHNVTITEMTYEQNGAAGQPGTVPFGTYPGQTQLSRDASGNVVPAAGDNAEVRYNPSFHSASLPVSSVTLYHELSHAYGIVTGTMQEGAYNRGGDNGIYNFERQAVGLSNTGLKYDFDNNPATRPTRDYPEALTENGLREEMGLGRRNQYTGSQTDVLGAGAAARDAPGGGDSHIHAMLKAMDANDPQALSEAMRNLAGDTDGAAFREQGAQEFEQQVQRQSTEQRTAALQPEQHDPVQTGGMRR